MEKKKWKWCKLQFSAATPDKDVLCHSEERERRRTEKGVASFPHPLQKDNKKPPTHLAYQHLANRFRDLSTLLTNFSSLNNWRRDSCICCAEGTAAHRYILVNKTWWEMMKCPRTKFTEISSSEQISQQLVFIFHKEDECNRSKTNRLLIQKKWIKANQLHLNLGIAGICVWRTRFIPLNKEENGPPSVLFM